MICRNAKQRSESKSDVSWKFASQHRIPQEAPCIISSVYFWVWPSQLNTIWLLEPLNQNQHNRKTTAKPPNHRHKANIDNSRRSKKTLQNHQSIESYQILWVSTLKTHKKKRNKRPESPHGFYWHRSNLRSQRSQRPKRPEASGIKGRSTEGIFWSFSNYVFLMDSCGFLWVSLFFLGFLWVSEGVLDSSAPLRTLDSQAK